MPTSTVNLNNVVNGGISDEGLSEDQRLVLRYVAETGLLPPVSGVLEFPSLVGNNSQLSTEGDAPAVLKATAGDGVDLMGWNHLQRFLKEIIVKTLALASTSIPQPATADSMNIFEAENQYLTEQFMALEAVPFTIQRLCEVLLNPFQYHVRKDPSDITREILKGDALQAAIRRSVLVANVDY